MGYVQLRDGASHQAVQSFEKAIANGHPYPNDHTLLLISLVQSQQYQRALEWAENGSKKHLTAEHIAWWARAAQAVGNHERAQSLFKMLLKSDGTYDGPTWVKDYTQPQREDP